MRWVLGVPRHPETRVTAVTKNHQMTELDTSALAGMPVAISRSPSRWTFPTRDGPAMPAEPSVVDLLPRAGPLANAYSSSSRAIYREEPSLSGTAP
jgi:hypothetical protein